MSAWPDVLRSGRTWSPASLRHYEGCWPEVEDGRLELDSSLLIRHPTADRRGVGGRALVRRPKEGVAAAADHGGAAEL